MQQSLFDDSPVELLSPSPAQQEEARFEEQRAAHKREVDRLRQQRHRARKRKGVTVAGSTVTLEKMSRTGVEMSRFQQSSAGKNVRDTPELRILLDTFFEVAESGEEPTRPQIERALDRRAKAEGVHIFNAGRFLDAAFERGALPRFEGVEWVQIPRELLTLLMESDG
jgi:hypothetical protein